uniref:Adhesin YadA n=1 Tax=Arsenophonus endosymbiont of Trialeurodes vaporariorum TaxID=235567 RepID=A0A3B0MKH5_9GAMM
MNIKKRFLMVVFISNLITCSNVQAKDSSLANGPDSVSKDFDSTAYGSYASAKGISSTSVGAISLASKTGSSAFGQGAYAQGESSLGVGFHANAETKDSVALGSNSKANRIYTDDQLNKIKDKITIDYNAKKNLTIGELSVGNLDGYVGVNSVGQYKTFRQITNVAPATQNEDATNLIQVKDLIDDKLSSLNDLKSLDKIKSESEGMKNKIAENENTAGESVTHINEYKDQASSSAEAAKAYEDSAKDASNKADNYKIAAEEAKVVINGIESRANNALAATTKYQDDAKIASEATIKNRDDTNLLVKEIQRTVSGKMLTKTDDTNIYIGKDLPQTTLSVSNNTVNRVIAGVANGKRDNEAVNFSQLESVKNIANHAKDISQKNNSRISSLENELSKTNTKIERGLATSAALNGLFQPYGVGKMNMTAAIGGYGSSQALAVGTGYRVDENVAFKAGIAYSGENDVMYNASFNIEW